MIRNPTSSRTAKGTRNVPIRMSGSLGSVSRVNVKACRMAANRPGVPSSATSGLGPGLGVWFGLPPESQCSRFQPTGGGSPARTVPAG